MSPSAESARAAGLAGGRFPLWSAAWLLSIAPLISFGALDASLGDLPRCALVWLPWLAVVGLPYATRGLDDEPGLRCQRDWMVAAGLALPSVALAAWLDGRGGAEVAQLWGAGLFGFALFALFGESAHRAAIGELRWYAPLWLLVVVGAPTLAAALEWVVNGALTDGSVAHSLAEVSPLGALMLGSEVFDAPTLSSLTVALTQPALVAALLLFSVVAFASRAAQRRST